MSEWRILIVDDNPINLRMMAETLSVHPDYALTLATDGNTAWELLNRPEAKFHLVILDRMMPGLDGLGVLRRMKAEEHFQHTPVIMQTALTEPEQVAEGITAGARYYLGKPYPPEALTNIVRSVIADLAIYMASVAQLASSAMALRLMQSMAFRFTTPSQAQSIAGLLATLCPNPNLSVMGLAALMINAVEHGNLEISYAETTQLKTGDGWEQEIARRLQLPEYRHRAARVTVSREDGTIRFCIEDQGKGFDWRPYLDFDPARMFDPNGRGIAMSRILFSRIEYQGCGNVVMAEI
jgi:CheY-like chemotaxis protein